MMMDNMDMVIVLSVMCFVIFGGGILLLIDHVRYTRNIEEQDKEED